MQVKLSDATPVILAYDGQVLECFFDEGGSKRVHIAHIKSIRLDMQGSGKHLLTIQMKHDQLLLWVDDAALVQATELVKEVQKGLTN